MAFHRLFARSSLVDRCWRYVLSADGTCWRHVELHAMDPAIHPHARDLACHHVKPNDSLGPKILESL